jgi:hypothetical protein
MNKILRFSALAIVISLWIASSGAAFSLFAQTTPIQAQGEIQIASDQAKAEAQTKDQNEARKAGQAQIEENTPVVKSYSLKFISASEFMRSAKFYVREYSGTETTLTVMILKKNIPDFEALLKKLDVEKKNIQFQVYTIVASKDDLPERFQSYIKSETKEITDKDLKAVLDELKGLWNFKHYWIETPSFLMAKDGSDSIHSKLVSSRDFELNLRNVQLRGEESGKRIISVGEIQLSQSSKQSLIFTTNITFKEKGYLVVGVSGVQTDWTWPGERGAALILIISAEIK